MKTALAWGDQPTDVLFPHGLFGITKSRRKVMKLLVAELNKKLKMAWQILQDETCQRCGTPSWYGRNEDNNVQFKELKSVCRGCSFLHSESDKRKDEKHDPGVTYYPQPVVAMPGTKLPTRDQWLEGKSTIADLPEFAGIYKNTTKRG